MKKFTFINTEGFKFAVSASYMKNNEWHLLYERPGEYAVFCRGQYRGQLYK